MSRRPLQIYSCYPLWSCLAEHRASLEVEQLGVLVEEMEYSHIHMNSKRNRGIWTFLTEVPQRKNSNEVPKIAPLIALHGAS
jgi:hypothetical protein